MTSPNRFESPFLLQIAMPMGGIGAGCICLSGQGGLQDFAIRNAPQITALPDSHSNERTGAFALLHVKGTTPKTRLLEGPIPPERIYDQGLQSQGYQHTGHEGMPRFEHADFENEYPFGHVNLRDSRMPLQVRITGFSPFIPRDDKNSSIPAAILEYAFTNVTQEDVEFEFSFHASNPVLCEPKENTSFTRAIPGRGVFFTKADDSQSESYGSGCLMALEGEPAVKGEWFRGGWFDSISALWRQVSTGSFSPNEGSEHWDRGTHERSGGSILFKGKIGPGETLTYPIVYAWHFPNCNLTTGGVKKPDPAATGCCGKDDDDCCSNAPAWRPYYAGVWTDAQGVAEYVRENYETLRSRTLAFKDALLSSTLPPEVLDAVSSNLAILKSPTVLRQENGNLWGWEGCFTQQGCCNGSCTHVWNYAQAFPHLFPGLERTLREQELLRSLNEEGHGNFRSALPDGPTDHEYHAASDGQLGGILKLWREWQISGDTAWMKSLYPAAKLSLNFCINHWDPERQGALVEPHHNTYDIEFWGPDGMCSSIYLGALCAMAELATAVGDQDYSGECRDLAERSAEFLDSQLFNGEYYQQKVMYEGLRDKTFAERIANTRQKEVLELLQKEGPKYQYGSGCLSDGIIGGWFADLYGVKTPLSPQNVTSTLRAIFAHNFREDLWDHVNLQRPGYALGHEPGLLVCTWPRGGKPTLPFVYSDEVWTGIEYQVASHLILHGMVEEGLAIVKGCRSRYDGRTRNPFNEYECGNYYARAMASYALLQSLSGFRYSAVTQVLEFGPRIDPGQQPFTCFFSADSGFGTITLEPGQLTVNLIEGQLPMQRVDITIDGETKQHEVNTIATPETPAKIAVN